jgi:hypothetical protein
MNRVAIFALVALLAVSFAAEASAGAQFFSLLLRAASARSRILRVDLISPQPLTVSLLLLPRAAFCRTSSYKAPLDTIKTNKMAMYKNCGGKHVLPVGELHGS